MMYLPVVSGDFRNSQNVFLFDSSDYQGGADSLLNSLRLRVVDKRLINLVCSNARSVLGFNGYTNTVSGVYEGYNYFTPLRYSFTDKLSDDFDFVIRPLTTVSGLTTIADSQNYAMDLNRYAVYLTPGYTNAGSTTYIPPLSIADVNCPYGSSGTVRVGILAKYNLVSSLEATKSVIATYCNSTRADLGFTLNSDVLLLQLPIYAYGLAGGTSSKGVSSYTFSSPSGGLRRVSYASNQTITLDYMFSYSPELRSNVILDASDFNPVQAQPGTSVKIQYKPKSLIAL